MAKKRELVELERGKCGQYIAYTHNYDEHIYESFQFYFCNKKQVISKLRNEYDCVVSNKII